ncbi:MAG: prepilin-type N-terminal cleavage/methylation domain-containing protein [Kiritimatiellae bacterium]|nr:prepilin-type N-terminal cleavage/methylation domain-containing protein [Kiritimatiellia bacterium]
MQQRTRRGFTLIELLVVVAIIGILIGLLFPAVKAAIEGGRRTQALTACKSLETAVKAYYNDNGKYPLQTAQNADWTYKTAAPGTYVALIEVLRGIDRTNNPRGIPYLDVPERNLENGRLLDPWDGEYQIMADYTGDNKLTVLGKAFNGVTVVVWSKGPDGKENTGSFTHADNNDNVGTWGN